MSAADSHSGRAPTIARSLTVPLTASSPIEPPGKRIGCTTNASVVNARRASWRPSAALFEVTSPSIAASPSRASAGFSNAGTISPSTS
jgi:hypothetical protein